jgi:hypothetical protein
MNGCVNGVDEEHGHGVERQSRGGSMACHGAEVVRRATNEAVDLGKRCYLADMGLC